MANENKMFTDRETINLLFRETNDHIGRLDNKFETSIQSVATSVEKLRVLLEGDGNHAGIIDRVKKNEEDINNMPKKISTVMYMTLASGIFLIVTHLRTSTDYIIKIIENTFNIGN